MSHWESIWISQLIVPLHVALKIDAKHGIDIAEIRLLAIGQRNLVAQKVRSEQHGTRYVIALKVSKRSIYLLYVDKYENDDSVWVLRTAMRASHPSQFRR